MTMLARLKPLNERKGHKTKIYTIDGHRFYADRGWYEVSDALAEKLENLHQEHYDDESPFLFDVASEEDAEKIDTKEEKAAADAKATARAPQKFRGRQTTQALPVNNAGGLAGIPGDLTTLDINKPINGNAPEGGAGAPSDELSDHNDEGRLADVGRVGPKTRGKTGNK